MKLAEDLKKAVLQAAMQGKLTKQLESDSNIFELLKTVEQTKRQLLERKEIKLEKFGDQVGNYDIPKNWAVVKLGTISGVITKQTGFDYTSHIKPFLLEEHKEDTIPMVQTKNFKGKKFDLETDYYIPLSIAENFPKILLRGKCLLFSIVGASIGNVGLYDSDVLAMIGGAICKVSLIDPCFYDYLFYYLQSNEGYKQIMKNYKSTAQGTITVQDVREIDVLLPPIEEQQRIVEKLNQILPLIDEYGKEEDELIALCKNFPEEMKKSVLQSAMQGKLTEQLETDSSVDELLKKIADEKAKLIKEGKIRKDTTKAGASGRALAEITEDEIPFDIPENWRWIKLGNIGTFLRGSGIKRAETVSEGLPCIRYGELYTTYKERFSKVKTFVPKSIYDKSFKIEKNDICMALTGENKFDIALAAVYQGETPIAMGGDMTRFRLIYGNPLYFVYAINSTYGINCKQKLATGDIICHISNDKLANIPFPLPPIEEQQRIVEKLNSILPIIDSMAFYGTKKKAGRPKQEEALAFISSLLGTNKSTDSKPVNPEITELKAKEELPAIVKKYASLMGVSYNRITIRHQKTRWGSCTKTGNLSFNCLLMKIPENVRDYVIIHELAHRKELNHSTKFWTIVAEYCPWYKEAKQWLKDNGQELMER